MESALPDILGDDIFRKKNMIESDIVALFAAAFDVDSTTNAGARRMRVHGIYSGNHGALFKPLPASPHVKVVGFL